MFWRFGGYGNVATIDAILDRAEFTLEELLDEADLIQELKNHNAKLIDYLREDKVLARLLDYVVAPRLEAVATSDLPPREEEEEKRKSRGISFSRPRSSSRVSNAETREEETEKKRNRYAFVAAEALSSENWSICEAVLSNETLLRKFWEFLKRPAPLDPLQASYFTKVNESLFDKKTDDMIVLLKSIDGAVADILRHVDCPMIMDLLLKIISLERTENGQGIVEWLYTQDVMPTLLSFLGPTHSWATQTSAGDFIKAIITVSANASQNEQTCIGPNELTRQLVSRPCVEQLVQFMLDGGNALTVGVGIIIEVIRKNNSDYDPDVGAESHSLPSSRDPIYLGHLLRLFAQHVPDFMNLVMNRQADRKELNSTFGSRIRPLGFDRFKTCELMAELLHCSNMGLLNEVGAEELIAARDAERKRLRNEGKLLGERHTEAQSSTQDLTMRMSHSSRPDEGRQLEVKNLSDDDGFEEVPKDEDVMVEDATHGFSKPEDSEPSAATTSFLSKDDDDFIDEPLEPPHSQPGDVTTHERTFSNPELVVAPLSPSKEKTMDLDSGATASVETTKVDDIMEQLQETLEAQPSLEQSQSSAPQSASDALAADVDKLEVADDTEAKALKTSTESDHIHELEAHDDEKPAPLFSTSDNTLSAADTAPNFVPEPSSADTSSELQDESILFGPSADQTETEQGSIILGGANPQRSRSHTPTGEPVQPVVGDYLKMQFVEYQVVPTILSFFFSYPWNNFLHNVVYDVVQQVFNGPMDRGFNPTLAVSLFKSADITTQIIKGQEASEASQTKTKTRMGYMGHLTLIAEEVVKFTDRHPHELLSHVVLDKVMAQAWVQYVEGSLAETRERDNAILGGVRPEVAMNNRLANQGLGGGIPTLGSAFNAGQTGGASSALAEAGLNGNLADVGETDESGANTPFAISAGASGFNNSSDEDEDDDIENEEDVHNEFRAYTDPLNAANSSMNPPSIPPPPPPPPPPLNAPPSRARLQLAARLAMAKRKAADDDRPDSGEGASSANAEGEGRGLGRGGMSGLLQSESNAERLRNPFADDEDDDDEDDEDDERITRRRRNSSDDEDEEDDVAGDVGANADAGSSSSTWNRGSWWRDMVRRTTSRSRSGSGARRRRLSGEQLERFGDGRDDDSDAEAANSSGSDDEEFGDFAMPEVQGMPLRPGRSSGESKRQGVEKGGDHGEEEGDDCGRSSSGGSAFDREREKVLLKPLPVHPPMNAGKGSTFSSLWPFSNNTTKKESPTEEHHQQQQQQHDENEKTDSTAGSSTPGEPTPSTSAATSDAGLHEKHDHPPRVSSIAADTPARANEAPMHLVDEDGNLVKKAREARRRTSLEGSDEDDGEEVVV